MDENLESIRVLVRIRPLSDTEIAEKNDSVIDILGERSLQVTSADGKKSFKCSFDSVLDQTSTQSDVYAVVRCCTESVLDGFNSTIFAYGQTGSGKTFSMYGPPNYTSNAKCTPRKGEVMGLIPRAVDEIFELAHNRSIINFQVHCSFVQIYNENLYDMLRDASMTTPLAIREENKEIYVQGLSEYNVKSVTDTLQLLKIAEENRAVRETHMNMFSSRSHSIFQIQVEYKRVSEEDGGEITCRSKFNLVDLAGSEKWNTKQNMKDQHIAEMTNINLSLHTLGKCISALAQSSQKLQQLLRQQQRTTSSSSSRLSHQSSPSSFSTASTDSAGNSNNYNNLFGEVSSNNKNTSSFDIHSNHSSNGNLSAMSSSNNSRQSRKDRTNNNEMASAGSGRDVVGGSISKEPSVVSSGIASSSGATTNNSIMHVPYRESKLTRLLQDSLGGNAKTFLIATISPARANAEESISTLKFADRAKRVMLQATINESRPTDHALVKRLQQEIEMLRNLLKRVVQSQLSQSQQLELLGSNSSVAVAATHNNKSSMTGAQLNALLKQFIGADNNININKALQVGGGDTSESNVLLTSLHPTASLSSNLATLLNSPAGSGKSAKNKSSTTTVTQSYSPNTNYHNNSSGGVNQKSVYAESFSNPILASSSSSSSAVATQGEEGGGLEYIISLEKALNMEQCQSQHLLKKNETLIKELEAYKFQNMQLNNNISSPSPKQRQFPNKEIDQNRSVTTTTTPTHEPSLSSVSAGAAFTHTQALQMMNAVRSLLAENNLLSKHCELIQKVMKKFFKFQIEEEDMKKQLEMVFSGIKDVREKSSAIDATSTSISAANTISDNLSLLENVLFHNADHSSTDNTTVAPDYAAISISSSSAISSSSNRSLPKLINSSNIFESSTSKITSTNNQKQTLTQQQKLQKQQQRYSLPSIGITGDNNTNTTDDCNIVIQSSGTLKYNQPYIQQKQPLQLQRQSDSAGSDIYEVVDSGHNEPEEPTLFDHSTSNKLYSTKTGFAARSSSSSSCSGISTTTTTNSNKNNSSSSSNNTLSLSYRVRSGPTAISTTTTGGGSNTITSNGIANISTNDSNNSGWIISSTTAIAEEQEEALKKELRKAKKKFKKQQKMEEWQREKEEKMKAEQLAQEEERRLLQETEQQKEQRRKEYALKQKMKLAGYQNKVRTEAEKIQELKDLGIDPSSLF